MFITALSRVLKADGFDSGRIVRQYLRCASGLFRDTFYNCSNLTGSIPVGLFGDISGAPAAYMFYGTFYNCSKLTGESALMPDGVTHLYEQFPTASGTDCDNCYFGATGLNDYATIPARGNNARRRNEHHSAAVRSGMETMI
jgi:hypothetical protein